MFSLHSTTSRRELVFRAHKDECLHVELKGAAVSASLDFWVYTDANVLNGFFQGLARQEKPWQGQRQWVSIEEDFSISATCTSLGSVTFRVSLLGSRCSPEEWRVEAGLVMDFGQLEQVAKQAEAFFSELG